MVSKQDIVDEIQRCADSPEYFIKTYVNIEHPIKGIIPFNLYKFQTRILNEVHEDVQDIDDLVPWVSSMVPAHGSKDNPWECNYCPYKSKCKPEEGV